MLRLLKRLIMPPMLDKAGPGDVKVTNGEPTNWYRFSFWGFPDATGSNKKALECQPENR